MKVAYQTAREDVTIHLIVIDDQKLTGKREIVHWLRSIDQKGWFVSTPTTLF